MDGRTNGQVENFGKSIDGIKNSRQVDKDKLDG